MGKSTFDLIDTALITGGAGGIGRAIAESLIGHGKKVLIAGRTESKLQETCKATGAAGYYVLDTSKVATIPTVSQRILKDHPDLNCLINNAGIQLPFEIPGSAFSSGEYGFELTQADNEIDVNIRGPIHLTVALLPHFASLPSDKSAIIMNVSSTLGFNPMNIVNPVYNATKAFIHSWTTNLRSQFEVGQKSQNRLKVIEIVPPMVATDLHRHRTDPDDNKKDHSKVTLELSEFMNEVEVGWEKGEDIVTAGLGHRVVQLWNNSIGKAYSETAH